MRLSRAGLAIGAGSVWMAGWMAWLLLGAALPLPPWNAEAVLAAEEAAAARLAQPARADVWSIDVGGSLQAAALGPGWSQHEAYVEGGRPRTFAWIDAEAADVAFASPGWDAAQLSLRAYPLDALAPLDVGVEIDGEPRATIVAAAGWTLCHATLGAVAPGRHRLTLRPRRQAQPPREVRALSLAVDGLAVGVAPVLDPERDRGVFAGWLRIVPDDRPAVFVSDDAAVAALPPGTAREAVAPGLGACYGFGQGRSGGPAAAVLGCLHGIVAAVLIALVPGLAWSGLLELSGSRRLAAALGLSALTLLMAFVVLRVVGIGPTPIALAVVLAIASGVPLPFLRGRGGIALSWLALGPALAAVAVLTFFATRVVPPLEDQDMEAQATAHALATRQVPAALTNRGTTYFFAHPPLLHLWQAGSFALAGRLGRVADYDAAARAAQKLPFVEPPPDAPLAARPHYAAWRTLLRRFLAQPELWPTRQVNVVLAAIAVGLFAHLAAAIALSRLTAAALALVLLTLPEFLVRGAYGGYFASTTLLSLLVVLAVHEGEIRGAGLASGLAALADQKGLLVPAAFALVAPRAAAWRRLVPIAGGLVGLCLFAAWGLAIDAPSFVYDFVKEHVVRRLTPSDVRFTVDAAHFYPSIPELWREFAARYGVLFTVWGAAAAVGGLRDKRPSVRAAAAAVLLGAAVFSLTDWRQTKHLAHLAAPALLAIAGAWPRPGHLRRAALAALLLLILRNLRAAWPLLASFEALRPGTSW